MTVLHDFISGESSVVHPSKYCTHFREKSPKIDIYHRYKYYVRENL